MDIHNYLLPHHFMACLKISSLQGLLPSWVRRLIDIPSDSRRPYVSSSRNTSLWEEESNSSASRQNTMSLSTVHVPGITVLPSLPPTYPPPTLKAAVHGYREYKPPPFHWTPPLEPPIIFISTSGHAADQSINGSSRCPTALWSSLLIQPLKIFVVKSNTL